MAPCSRRSMKVFALLLLASSRIPRTTTRQASRAIPLSPSAERSASRSPPLRPGSDLSLPLRSHREGCESFSVTCSPGANCASRRLVEQQRKSRDYLLPGHRQRRPAGTTCCASGEATCRWVAYRTINVTFTISIFCLQSIGCYPHSTGACRLHDWPLLSLLVGFRQLVPELPYFWARLGWIAVSRKASPGRPILGYTAVPVKGLARLLLKRYVSVRSVRRISRVFWVI